MRGWAPVVVAAFVLSGLTGAAVRAQGNPEKDSAYFGYGVNALKAGNLKDADVYFRSAADEVKFPKGDKPFRAQSLFLLGLTYQEAGRSADADKALREAFALDPTLNSPARIAEARRTFNLKAPAPATQTSAAKPVPPRPTTAATRWTGLALPAGGPQGGMGTAANELYYAKGWLQKKQYDDAAQRLRYAIAADPNNAEAHAWLFAAYLGLGRTAEANQALQKAYALDPSLRAHEAELRAVAAPSKAWSGLTYSSNAPPAGTAARDLFDAKDSLRNNMPATAKDQFLRAIAKNPSLAEAHFWLAGAYAQLGDAALARTSLARAYQLDGSLRAHEGELARFGSRTGGNRPTPPRPSGKGVAQCDDLYATCVASSFGLGSRGGADFSRQATCTAERNQCYARNR